MNSAHIHKNPETGTEEDAFGLREHCNICRKAKGQSELSETDLKLMKSAAKAGPAGSGSEPVEQLLADLKEQEEINDQLRGQLKEKDAELALLRKENEQLKKKRAE